MSQYRWVLTVLMGGGLLAALGMAGVRWRVEQGNRLVELVADYDQIVDLATDTGIPLDTVLQRLQQAGLTSVAVSEETVAQLLSAGKVEVQGEVEVLPEFAGPADGRNLFLITSDRNRFERILNQLQHKYPAGVVTPLTPLVPPAKAPAPSSGKPSVPILSGPPWILRVQEEQARLNQVGLGLPEEAIRRARRAGLRVVARLRNFPGLTPEAARFMLQQVRDQQIATVIFLGDEVLGFRELIQPVAEALQGGTAGPPLHFGLIEFARQRGEQGLAQAVQGAVVRVHSITEQEMRSYSQDRAVERFARAVRERNIRLCFVRLFLGPQEDKLSTNEDYLRLLDRHFRRAFLKAGPAQPFEPLQTPWGVLALLGIGVLAALLLALEGWGLVSARPGLWLLLLGVWGAGALLAVSPAWYRKLLALGAGLLFPTWAGGWAFRSIQQRLQGPVAGSLAAALGLATALLWRTTLISLAGALFIVGLLADRTFLVRIDQFAGVKLTQLLPFLLVAGLIVGRLLDPAVPAGERWREACRQYRDLAQRPLLLYHVILAGAILIALAILLLRSGNEGLEPSAVEIRFRDLLERLLFVRPRTKEFLLGHPFLFLGAAMAALGRPQWLLPCLLVGLVGQVSTLNTFCHIHTPLFISLVRTFHALWLGTLGGAVLTLLARRHFPLPPK